MIPEQYRSQTPPEGATHYTDGSDGFSAAWYKFVDGVPYVVAMNPCLDGRHWSQTNVRDRNYHPILSGGCSRCGCTGLHACVGRRLPPPTPEAEARLTETLERIFGKRLEGNTDAMLSRNVTASSQDPDQAAS